MQIWGMRILQQNYPTFLRIASLSEFFRSICEIVWKNWNNKLQALYKAQVWCHSTKSQFPILIYKTQDDGKMIQTSTENKTGDVLQRRATDVLVRCKCKKGCTNQGKCQKSGLKCCIDAIVLAAIKNSFLFLFLLEELDKIIFLYSQILIHWPKFFNCLILFYLAYPVIGLC